MQKNLDRYFIVDNKIKILNFLDLQKYDSRKMYEIYHNWPEMAESAYNSPIIPTDHKNIDHIVFSGMGGSGALGDIFQAILSKTNIHVTVVKGYHLPKTVNNNTLVVTTSVSGNTDETLKVLNLAKEQESKIISFASGGKMEKYCKKNNIEFQKIPQIHSPRTSFVNFLYSMLKSLQIVTNVNNNDILESISFLKNQRANISFKNLNQNNQSLKLANWIKSIPLIYYPWGLQSSAIRFKNSLQENSKTHAITEDIIESSHNGVVAWSKSSDIQPILLRGKNDFEKTIERWEILKEFFENNNIDYYEIISVEGNIISKLINLIYLLDYTTIYKSVISEIDPSPVKPIEYIKKHLK